MKFLCVFVAFATVLGVVNAIRYTPCFRNPCNPDPCAPGERCIANYINGCSYDCVPNPDPFVCPTYKKTVECFQRPCDANPCAANQICCDNYSKGCNRECYPK